MASSPSFSSPPNWVYDVFPSFSGEDVRKGFLSHFLKELDRKLIVAFKDNEIERSQSLDPELKKAIRTSRIAVVVFSKNYASSSWCLNELLEIVKCKEEFGQMVIPVFYRLEPSHVRKQTGKFGEVFANTCLEKTEEETKLWRQSLTDVANILGYHSLHWHNEAKMIKAIASDILGKMNLIPSKEFEDFVGMEDHIANMSVLLHLESKEVRMVGIWGSSGIGKTTIARVLSNRLSHGFQSCVFIDRAFIAKSMKLYNSANPDDYNMKLHMQRNFLSKILGKKEIKIDCLGAIEERLKHHKVLIFIDDLDDQMVLDTLAGQSQWFGSGSRIIVITKDKHFLRAHGIDHIYEVCLPSEKLALKMLCRYGFRQNDPPDGFMEIASEVALRAGKLPLGLNVLGSSLRGRDQEDWRDMLLRLRNALDGKIEKTLRLGYDGLHNKNDKAIFRHIACLFNYERVHDVRLLLADSDLDVNIGLKNLVDKSLIHVRHKTVEMHHLLQDMGKEIVCAQSNEPGEREFLVDSKDICDLLEENTGTKRILGISLDMEKIDELHIHENAFKGMRNLIFLKMCNTRKPWEPKKEVIWHLPEGFDYLPPKLRLLRLEGYPMRCMPSSFRPENLVKFQMQDSKLEKLWEGVHSLAGLMEMDLRGSTNLEEIPNLSMATNIKTLDFSYCSSLVELTSSIQYLSNLEKLDMSFCEKLETLPTGMNLQSLVMLELKGCSRLRSFPNISTNILYLTLSESGIEEFPSNLRLGKLVRLGMDQMKSEKLWERVQPLTPLMTMLSHSLKRLFLSDIPSLVEIPSSIQKFNILEGLSITHCINLDTLPVGINLEYLDFLDLSGCSRLKSFPDISTNISHLLISETGIEEVPWWIQNFSRLKFLKMEKCNSLKRLSLNIYKLKRLTANFSGCRALTAARWNHSPSEVAVATDNIHSKLTEPHKPLTSSINDFYRNFSSGLIVLDDSFPKILVNPRYYYQSFGFTFNLSNLDADAIFHQRSIIFNSMILSGEEVPSYFTHRTTTGISLTNIPLFHISPSQRFFRFRVCAVIIFDPMPVDYMAGVYIRVNCRFKGKFGNSFDSVGRTHDLWADKEDGYLFILDCRIPLNDGIHIPLAPMAYDHVDMQIHIRNIQLEVRNGYTIKLKGWGIRVLEDSSSATEDNMVNETEHGEESGDSCEDTEIT